MKQLQQYSIKGKELEEQKAFYAGFAAGIRYLHPNGKWPDITQAWEEYCKKEGIREDRSN